MLLQVRAAAGSMGGVGEGGLRVNVISVSLYVFYVYFLVSCVHAALKTVCVQLSRVFYLSSPVQGWEQALSLAGESMIVICTHTQKHPIK